MAIQFTNNIWTMNDQYGNAGSFFLVVHMLTKITLITF